MKFCQMCNNLFYTKIDEGKLIYHCKYCNYNREFDNKTDNCEIYNSTYNSDTESYRESVNQYSHLDPTLPRVCHIKCSNDGCISHSEPEKNEIIYIKYNQEKMNYIYLCVNCKTVWKSDSN